MPDQRELGDADLVRRCCTGDHHAWRTLYERHVRQVQRFVALFGVPAPEREDAVQEIFLTIYRALPGFRGEARLSTWAYRIAARHCAAVARRRRVGQLLSALWLRQEAVTRDARLSVPHEDALLLPRLLARLSPRKRTVIVLHELEGLSVEEIAAIVQCPVNTVWSRLHHARAELVRLARLAEQDGLRRTAGREAAQGRREGASP